MVSLGRHFATDAGEGSTVINDTDMDPDSDVVPIFNSFNAFKPLKTAPVISIHLVGCLILEILGIVYASKHPDPKSRCAEYFIIMYVHVGWWFLTLVVDSILHKHHHNLRIHGYLDFYNKVVCHQKLPFYVVSLWTATLLGVQTLMHQYYPNDFADKCLKGGTMSPLSYICAYITVEVCILVGIHVNYLVKVVSFNRAESAPDVQRDEWAGAASLPQDLTSSYTEIGTKQAGGRLYDLLQKQADLIRFLKEHNGRLGEKLVIANAQLQARRGDPTGQQ